VWIETGDIQVCPSHAGLGENRDVERTASSHVPELVWDGDDLAFCRDQNGREGSVRDPPSYFSHLHPTLVVQDSEPKHSGRVDPGAWVTFDSRAWVWVQVNEMWKGERWQDSGAEQEGGRLQIWGMA
jgi:hypothetical protein